MVKRLLDPTGFGPAFLACKRRCLNQLDDRPKSLFSVVCGPRDESLERTSCGPVFFIPSGRTGRFCHCSLYTGRPFRLALKCIFSYSNFLCKTAWHHALRKLAGIRPRLSAIIIKVWFSILLATSRRMRGVGTPTLLADASASLIVNS